MQSANRLCAFHPPDRPGSRLVTMFIDAARHSVVVCDADPERDGTCVGQWYDMHTGMAHRHDPQVYGVRAHQSPDGRTVALARFDAPPVVYRLHQQVIHAVASVPDVADGFNWNVAWSTDGRWLAASYDPGGEMEDPVVVIYDVVRQMQVAAVIPIVMLEDDPCVEARITGLAWAHQGGTTHVLGVGLNRGDGLLYTCRVTPVGLVCDQPPDVIGIEAGTDVQVQLTSHHQHPGVLAFVGPQTHQLVLHDVRTDHQTVTTLACAAPLQHTQMFPTGDIWVCHATGVCQIYHATTQCVTDCWYGVPSHTRIAALAASRAGDVLVTADTDGTVYRWQRTAVSGMQRA